MALKIFADTLRADEVQWYKTPGGIDYCVVSDCALTTSRRREAYLRDESRTGGKVPDVQQMLCSIGRSGSLWRVFGLHERPVRRFDSYDDCVSYIAQVIDERNDGIAQSQVLVGEQRW